MELCKQCKENQINVTRCTTNRHGKHHSYNDKPSVVFIGGSEYWHKNGKLHREEGPAWISRDNPDSIYAVAFYKNGKPQMLRDGGYYHCANGNVNLGEGRWKRLYESITFRHNGKTIIVKNIKS